MQSPSQIETEQFGIHLLIDGYGASKEVLKDKAMLRQMLVDLPLKMCMHTISEPFVVEVGPLNKKDPGGVSGFILIAESHISFHTFPDRGFITIDVYTCQNTLDTDGFVTFFKNTFNLMDLETHVQKRGTRYPKENIY